MKSTLIKSIIPLLILIISLKSYAQNNLIKSGPMLGYNTMKEVGIWLQTNVETKVKIKYYSTLTKSEIFETKDIHCNEENHHIAKFILNKVQPGVKYSYEVYANEERLEFDFDLEFTTQELWQYRKDPPDFEFVLGSCVYVNDENLDRPGDPYGGDYEIFKSMTQHGSEFMLWLGDNNYLREPDWNSETGIYYRYSHSRDIDELQPLLSSMHHYAIWDDHDFGPNNSDGTFWNKNLTESAFKDFWMNPNYNLTGKGGITGTFFWNDCQFFLMDNRYFRTANNRNTGDPTVFGKEQIEWLINALKSSRATFKFIVTGGQFISDARIYENHINLSEKERNTLLDILKKEKIEGVIFLSGDRHHTELSVLKDESFYPLYDWTVSPLTSTAYEIKDEGNTNLVEGSSYGKRNYGIVEVKGPRKERELNLRLFDVSGKEIWHYTISNKDLK